MDNGWTRTNVLLAAILLVLVIGLIWGFDLSAR